MAEKKIVKVEETKENKKGLNIDLTELKKIGAAILSFVISNPEILSKLLEKPANYLKKIVNGEDVSKDTKKTVNDTINKNKSGGITSILTSLSNLSGGDKETNDIFGSITSTIKGAQDSGIDIGKVANMLLGSNNKAKSKKTNNSQDGLSSLLKGLFK